MLNPTKTKNLEHWAIIAVFAVILSPSFNATAQAMQYVTLYSGTNAAGVQYPLQTNQIVSLAGYDWADSPYVSGSLSDGTSLNLLPINRGIAAGGGVVYTPVTMPQIFTGLTNITIQPSQTFATAGWATFQITTPASVNVISNYVPADAIVIPASATGDVQIILESSMDLLNWTAANPGTYGASSTTNRFFRVRAVHN